MKKIIASLMLVPCIAFADRIDDLKHHGKQAYCTWVARHIFYGVDARLKEAPLRFTVDDDKQPGIHLADGPYTDQELTHIIKNITIGWQLMDNYLKSHSKPAGELNAPYAIGLARSRCQAYEEV